MANDMDAQKKEKLPQSTRGSGRPEYVEVKKKNKNKKNFSFDRMTEREREREISPLEKTNWWKKKK